MTAAIKGAAGVVDVDALQCRGKTIGITLAPDLTVGNDVETGLLLLPDRDDGRVVLRLL